MREIRENEHWTKHEHGTTQRNLVFGINSDYGFIFGSL